MRACVGILLATIAASAAGSLAAKTSARQWIDFGAAGGFKVFGAVQLGVSLEGNDLAASLKRGGDGQVARFAGGRLVGEAAAPLLQSLEVFTFGVRLKPEGEFIRGTVCVQRGARETGSGAFELSGWRMPFLEREHLTFQGMFRDGLLPSAGKYFPAINLDQDRYAPAASGWRDVVLTKAKGGAMQMYLDGQRVVERRRASIVPGASAWAFEGKASPLCIGADAEGGLPFRGWLDHVAIWDRVLAPDEIAALCGVEKVVEAVVKQPGKDRIFGNGILMVDTPVAKRYDWVDAQLPAFRERLAQNDPHLPRYHLTLPGEMWNPIAFFHGGKYHLFQGWSSGGCFSYFEDTSENIVWQHLMSRDLLHWTIQPMPIRSPLYPNENETFFEHPATRWQAVLPAQNFPAAVPLDGTPPCP